MDEVSSEMDLGHETHITCTSNTMRTSMVAEHTGCEIFAEKGNFRKCVGSV